MLPSGVHFIQRGWFNSNSVLIQGEDGVVIVDTGHRDDSADLLHRIQQTGLRPADIRLIVNTHCHWDHHGGNAAIQTVSGAKVMTGAKTAERFACDQRREMWLDYFGVEMNLVTADLILHPGETVELAGLPFEIIATPGHAPDAISLYQPDHRLLICADVLMEGGDCGILNTAVHGEGVLDEAMTTVEHLMTYDITITLPGHGNLITDTPGNLSALAHRLERFRHEPAQMAFHLARRVLMTYLMSFQPMTMNQLTADMAHTPWVHDYMPRCGYTDPTAFVADLVDEFIKRGLVRVENGMLESLVAR